MGICNEKKFLKNRIEIVFRLSNMKDFIFEIYVLFLKNIFFNERIMKFFRDLYVILFIKNGYL